jgi:DNA-binding NarL/FixJ family response regulator
MAQVFALVPDLLFGSRVQGSLAAAGHEVELVADERRLRERLTEQSQHSGEVLVVDLTDEQLDGSAILESLAADDALEGIQTLAFYSHVDTAVRERATQAGFDLIVPRSRMAREGPELVARLAAV